MQAFVTAAVATLQFASCIDDFIIKIAKCDAFQDNWRAQFHVKRVAAAPGVGMVCALSLGTVGHQPAGRRGAERVFERIQSEPGRVRMHLRGGLDGEASRAMRDSLAALAEVAAREVVLDLSHVTFIDGSGLGAISFLFKRLSARGRRLAVVGVSGQPLATLRHVGVAALLGVKDEPASRPVSSFLGMAWAR